MAATPAESANTTQQTLCEVIYRLARAAEYREEDTYSHLHRMSHGVAELARAMGMEPDFVERLSCAAPFHDIGKVGIPDRILLKPTKLVDWEWEVMKQHTTLGKRILEGSDLPVLRMGETIAYTHHERWDGMGYPRGLQGSEIPVEGQIVSLVDVFDNLSSRRPYRDACSLDEAFEAIREGSGSQFSTEMVEVFLGIRDRIIQIKEQFEECGESIFLQMVGRLHIVSHPTILESEPEFDDQETKRISPA